MKILQIPRKVYAKDLDWKAIFASQLPVVLEGIAKDWPAIANLERKWSNLEALSNRVAEEKIVRVEIGKNYMDPDMKVLEVPMQRYLSMLINKTPSKAPYYLAQYSLQNIPEMYEDVQTPEICSTGKGHLYLVNIWFGWLQGNTSPCHYDPFNNVLVQVIGKKAVEIINPLYSNNLYPARGTMQSNTSRVDFENPNLQKFPKYQEIEKYTVELQPGDGVFIPYKWWHYCKSSELSCSVNFWWI